MKIDHYYLFVNGKYEKCCQHNVTMCKQSHQHVFHDDTFFKYTTFIWNLSKILFWHDNFNRFIFLMDFYWNFLNFDTHIDVDIYGNLLILANRSKSQLKGIGVNIVKITLKALSIIIAMFLNCIYERLMYNTSQV